MRSVSWLRSRPCGLPRLRRSRLLRRGWGLGQALACLPAAAQAWLRWRGRSPLDRAWYAEQGFRGRRGQLAHYLLVGRRAGWSAHPLLEPEWLAPDTWRRPWPEPLLDADARRATHPVLAPGAVSPPQARALRPGTELAVVLGARPTLPYAVLRDAVVQTVRGRQQQERVRLLPRSQRVWRPPSGLDGPPAVVLPSVTVVLPVRDRPRQVVAAIASVQAQTHREWQLVVVDDGSSDATPEVVAQIAAQDPRIRLVRTAHAGVSAARNRGAAGATTDLLAWLDSDNTWTPDYLRRMLSVLARTDTPSAYAVLHQYGRGGGRYRALDAGLDALVVQNHIDLNVLVARRADVEAVGGFDPTLRRAVDYDLVLRLAARARPVFVPFVGARYDERHAAADRITVREPQAWSDLVRARRLVDWAGLERGVGARVADRLSVVVPLPRAVPLAHVVPTLLDALPRGEGDDIEVVVVDEGGRRATGTALAGLGAADARLTVLRWPVAMTPGWALAHALGHTSGAHVAVLDAGCRLAPGFAATLRRALATPAVVVEPGLLAARAFDLVAARGADALLGADAWRFELADRLERSTCLPRRAAGVLVSDARRRAS